MKGDTMNNKLDRRSQRTRKLIFEAFNELLAKNQYSKITVQSIIHRANIGRTTFYSHFQTKDELLYESCKMIFEHVFAEKVLVEATHDFSQSSDFKDYITHILYHLKDNKKIIKSMLKFEDSGVFMNSFKEYIHKYFSNVIQPVNTNNIDIDFINNHIVSSFIQAIRWWFHHNLKESPEKVANSYIYMINHLI
ncbi:hypothetical protein CCE28_12710 [Anaeromicrobium sediminis]|uniref:HTH tetR-type domain-containing protein n=2 Tax=Anaeromicrobium sediminis TaxID=1478221 RepID=A0A267MJE7_9FIRM|nr:hypothetical protein CCE28_12710 [Anaeromicrobium sediminis]